MAKYLINASNLHNGGGVQVATSVIGELSKFQRLPAELTIWVSDEVEANLLKSDYDVLKLPKREIVNSYGITMMWSPLASRLKNFDSVFTIFGPLYVWKFPGNSIVGFAQPWIIYPDNEIANSMSFVRRVQTRVKFYIQSIFFRRADRLIVELDHVYFGLLKKRIGSADGIEIIRNSFSSIYNNPSKWRPLSLPVIDAELKIGFVGRNYSHKNTKIFPSVLKILSEKYNVKAAIYVTFTNEEWMACSDEFRASVINVGPLFVDQCPSFYLGMDAVIFPSLLECFSATPLEAMIMKKTLFVSDRPFNRDVCQAHAHYFDPLSPDSAARTIAHVMRNRSSDFECLEAAREYSLHFSNARERAEKYIAQLTRLSIK